MQTHTKYVKVLPSGVKNNCSNEWPKICKICVALSTNKSLNPDML